MRRKQTQAQPQEAAIAATRLAFGILREEAPFNDRGFSARTIRALMDNGVDSPERLLFMTKEQVRKLHKIGKASLAEINNYRQRFIPKDD
jgi:DNA-directed RNA polymerase alpha subunit